MKPPALSGDDRRWIESLSNQNQVWEINGDRPSICLRTAIAWVYRLFQKLNDRLGLRERLYLESSLFDHMSWL